MASGMEMMVVNLLKSMGFNPSEIEQNIKAYAGALRQNLDALNAKMGAIDARLERIEQALNISVPATEREEDKAVPRIVQQ
jgi:TRAP-type uncharacterized transport system substrate-binding protein